ncbi:hypothetical protein L596_022996 [Steinernema carpocapsae]|uniref:Uncharacterized protein n=1 Tax=Steinernema carpocapsae TaxID=34508 RepID=A0A4U5MCB4_STECR|nr:hypothetical protein L596_022996 [Steinernema carpocapsae]
MGSGTSTIARPAAVNEAASPHSKSADLIPEGILDADQVLLLATAERGEFKDEEVPNGANSTAFPEKSTVPFSKKWF